MALGRPRRRAALGTGLRLNDRVQCANHRCGRAFAQSCTSLPLLDLTPGHGAPVSEHDSGPAIDSGDGPPVRVFLSYRRTDDINFVGRFHDRLLEEFGDEQVFRDLDSLHGGSNFPRVIREELRRIDAVVAMIGPTWAARLREPGDFVTLEISEALARGCPVIPVLVEDTELPTVDQLPDELRGLVDLNAARVRKDPDFRHDATRAIEGVRREADAFRAQQVARARAEDERRAAAITEAHRLEGLARERVEVQAELDRIEYEAQARRLAEERQRLAAIDAELAEARKRDARAETADHSEGSGPIPDPARAPHTSSSEDAVSAELTSTELASTELAPVKHERRQRRGWLLPSLAILALVGGVVMAILRRDGDDASGPAGTTASTVSNAPTETTATHGSSATSAVTDTTATHGSSATSAPTASGSVDCQPLEGLAVRFCDGFEGASLDPTKWVERANGGTVTVADGEVAVSTSGGAFPYITSARNPFPDRGAYQLTIAIRYRQVGPFGTGVLTQAETPLNGQTPDVPQGGDPAAFVWQDLHNVFNVNNDCASTGLPGDTSVHVVRLTYEANGSRSISIDGGDHGQCTGAIQPTVLWFGNWGVPNECPECQWSEFSIQFVRVDVPS